MTGHPTADDIVKALRRLPAPVLERVAKVVMPSGPLASSASAGDVGRVLSEPSWLVGAVRTLDPHARFALRLVARAPNGLDPARLDELATHVGGGLKAVAQLESAGVAFRRQEFDGRRSSERLSVLAPLRTRLLALASDGAPDAAPPEPAVQEDDEQEARLVYGRAVLLAAVEFHRPRLTRLGEPHRVDFKPIQELLQAIGVDAEAGVLELDDLGLTHVTDGKLCASSVGVEAWTEPLLELVHRALATLRAPDGIRACAALLGRSHGWVPELELRDLIAASAIETFPESAWHRTFATQWRQLDAFPGMCVTELAGRRWRRLSRRVAAVLRGERVTPFDAEQIYVQPNLQIVAGPGVAVEVFVLLGRIAKPVSVDRVTVFEIDRTALKRAATDGLAAEEILGRLEKSARHGVPGTAARLIVDHARALAHARMASGTVVVVEADIAVIRKAVGDADFVQLAPGVYVFDDDPSEIRQRLHAAGIGVETTTLAASRTDRSVDAELERYAEKARAELERLRRVPAD